MKHVWLWWQRADVLTEKRQLEEEGKDITPLAAQFAKLSADGADKDPAFQGDVDSLLDQSAQLPVRKDFAYAEPSDLEPIRAERPDGPRVLTTRFGDELLRDRIHGAWLGRCIGCLLGKPIEGWRTPKLWGLLADGGKSTITDYLWRMDIAPGVFDKHEARGLLEFGKGIAHMPEDDDTNYTITGMAVVKKHGLGFTGENVADFWMNEIPILHTCTAERVAYRNFILNVAPPLSARVRNPYREWIGAQIRADAFGYVAAGRPQLAAELAWRDASISHVRNGIYGEMWVAAMLAAAAVESSVQRVITLGLSEVPKNSRFAEAIREVLAWRQEGADYAQAVQRIHARWDEQRAHDWCHTISNAQIVATALLWGEGDFETAVTRAVYPCFDTDCNGATVGSVVGMMLGARKLPEKWSGVLHDKLLTGICGYNTTRISVTAGLMFEMCKAGLAG